MNKFVFMCLVTFASLSFAAQTQASETKVLNISIPAHCLSKTRVENTTLAGDSCFKAANQLHEDLMKKIKQRELDHQGAQDIFQTEQMIRMLTDYYWLGAKE
ncbi:MAG: hypothetical protein IPM97_03365 [Bdellovibrionaceae bacterium]|nr:hypothetical protein [Pseudobdellovibrionaceae bacterium]